MSKQEAIMHYKAALAVFKKWHEAGIISTAEFAIISTNAAEKYGINSTSINLEISPD